MALSSVLFTGFYLRTRPSHYGKFISTESLSDHKAEGSAWRGAELASRALAWCCSLPGSWGWRCVTWAGSPRPPWPWPLRPQSARWPRGALFKAQCAAVTVLNDRAQGRDIATCARATSCLAQDAEPERWPATPTGFRPEGARRLRDASSSTTPVRSQQWP